MLYDIGPDYVCPFCNKSAATNMDDFSYHLEVFHSEGQSPFVAQDGSSDSDIAMLATLVSEADYYPPIETILCSEISEADKSSSGNRGGRSELSSAPANIEASIVQTVVKESSVPATSSRVVKPVTKTVARYAASKRTKRCVKYRERRKEGQLTTKDLGPFAYEDQMPSALRKLLQTDGTPIYEKIIVPGQAHIMKINKRIPNWSKGIIPVLQQLIEQDPDTAYAYTCSPAVTHISKLKNEGSFCGYRNIQMLTSFVIADKFRGHEVFEGKVPTIFDIQDTIEDAWDVGIHSYNRISTGGIKGTRRYIGTPEAQAFFEYLNIPMSTGAYRGQGEKSFIQFMATVREYFKNQCEDTTTKIRRTKAAPVYFQHPGHSMTIVGYEVKRDGSSNLLVFDPGFEDEPDVVDMIGRKVLHRRYKELLELYRKDAKYLSKHDAFEVLMLVREGDDSEDRSNPGLILKLGWLHQELQNRPEGTLSRDDTMLKMGLVEGTRDNSADTGV